MIRGWLGFRYVECICCFKEAWIRRAENWCGYCWKKCRK